MNKQKLRKEFVEKRKNLAAAEIVEMSKKAAAFIKSLDEYKAAKTVAAYYPVKGELDVRELLGGGKTVALPVCNGENMNFYADYTDLKQNRFGIPEPCGGRLVLPNEFDFVIVPAVIFGRNFHRIGYGGGFYDRFLPQTNCVKCGTGYNFQLLQNIDAGEYDVSLDIIVTDKEIIKNKN